MSLICTETLAPLPVMERATSYVLNGDPKGKNFVYTNGKNVIMRDIANPKKCDIYSGHKKKVGVAQYAPSGNYICSGDETGEIQVWDTINAEHIMKSKFQPIGGKIKDISWGPESKRLAVCGEGRTLHAAVILADSGNSVGKLDQLEKRANSISYKPTRPYRLATGDDKHHVHLYEGPPFKIKFKRLEHSRFVQSVRYSPDGKYLATASSDNHVFLYDGKTSELIGQLGDEKKGAHSGGIYSISWSPDSKELLTASSDKSVKIWNVETREEVVHFILGNAMEDQQLASLWMGDYIITLSLSGVLNYLDRNNPSKPSRNLHGHSKALSKIIVIGDTHITGDVSGKMLSWDIASGDAKPFVGNGHTNKVSGLVYDPTNKQIISTGWDDKIRFTCASTLDFSTSTVIGLDKQPQQLVLAADGYVVILDVDAITLFKNCKKLASIPNPEDFVPSCIAANGKRVAFEAPDKKIVFYDIESDALVKSCTELSVPFKPDKLSISPDGSKMCVSWKDQGIIRMYEVVDNFEEYRDLVGHHTRLSAFAWSPDSQLLASTATDDNLRVWNIPKKDHRLQKAAHPFSSITDIAWIDNNNLCTVGDDSFIRHWSISW